MAAPKRIQQQREQDLLFIERLYVRGKSQREIAAELATVRDYTLSRVTIAKDINTILERWRAEMIRDVDALKASELARINRLEREAWDAWDRSREMREKRITEQTDGTHAGHKARLEREQLLGDPRFLQTIQWCIKQRCDILGLLAPVQVEGHMTTSFADMVRVVAKEEALGASTACAN